MNEERTGKCLRQVEQIRGHLCQIFHNGQPSHGDDRKILVTYYRLNIRCYYKVILKKLIYRIEHLLLLITNII